MTHASDVRRVHSMTSKRIQRRFRRAMRRAVRPSMIVAAVECNALGQWILDVVADRLLDDLRRAV